MLPKSSEARSPTEEHVPDCLWMSRRRFPVVQTSSARRKKKRPWQATPKKATVSSVVFECSPHRMPNRQVRGRLEKSAWRGGE